MAKIRHPANHKAELGVIGHLKKSAAFSGCAIVAKGDGGEAPERLPCIIVHCPQVSRSGDIPYQVYAKEANITCSLYADSESMKQQAYESIATELECRMEDLTGMQTIFNKPASGRDRRKNKGMHLHYITEFQTDADTDGTQWEYGVGCTLIVEEIDE